MKEKKIHFSRGEVAEIYTRAKVDFETGKEVKREILDRERDRRKTITEESCLTRLNPANGHGLWP